ncbi:unnamed protein product [Caenorhabditis nigoni]
MQRHERIRFFITEQCRSLDPTYRNYFFPKQILLGDTPLPLIEGSMMTFRINSKKKISFRIRLVTEEEPLNIGIPLTQIESISIKDKSAGHPEPAIIFLLKNEALEKFVRVCEEYLDNPLANGNRRCMSKYLTVILGQDQHSGHNSHIYCRVKLMANQFTFPFRTAKKILLKDVPIMWNKLLDAELERRTKTGTHHDREQIIAEMDDAAWEWFMTYLRMKWEPCPIGGYWFAKNVPNPANRGQQSLPTKDLLDAKKTIPGDESSNGSTSPESTSSVKA